MQTVKLTSRREVAPAVYELLFTRPEDWTFEAGQFARLGLAVDSAEPVFRAYSIAGSPESARLLLCGNPDFVRETRALMKARGIVSPRLGKPGQLLVESLW